MRNIAHQFNVALLGYHYPVVVECTECGIEGQFADSPFINVTLLRISDIVSNHQHINYCMSSGGNSQIDYREQNTLIDPCMYVYCLTF